ncbi:hypothetical protein WA026_011597 [Henosepilachna vigintioctopunctata]|uniref:Glycine cleavage system H protein n=1 Tax=Henosepilachna vigintioctopunctata TaxID=420089 RepID=A0AAW1TM27_9CUCU
MILPRVALEISNIFSKSEVLRLINRNRRFIHSSICYLGERRFTEKHEWVEVDGKIGTIGISNYAQEALGDVVYAQLPDLNRIIKQKDECGALESVKAASEIFSPVSGKIIQKNTEVEEVPSLINSSCYEKGWLFKVELTNESEVDNLMTEDQYKKFLKAHEDH